MDALQLKIILLVAMAVIALCFGLLPIKINDFVEKKQKSGDGGFGSLALSMLSCLSGGVFLGVCLLDLFPFANETYESVKTSLNWATEYPFVELIVGAGFFLVYLIEEVSLKVCRYEEGSKEQPTISSNDCEQCKDCEAARSMEMSAANAQAVAIELQVPPQRSRAASLVQAARKAVDVGQMGSTVELVKSITFIMAFTLHSSLEGFAFGVQDSTLSVATLFFGIIVHKAVVAFSIGLRLIRSHPSRKLIVVLLIVFVASTAPIGAVIGIAVRNSDLNAISKDIVSVVLTCIALGTFLYITFFEILFAEISNNESKLLQWLSTAIGFTVIALLMIYE